MEFLYLMYGVVVLNILSVDIGIVTFFLERKVLQSNVGMPKVSKSLTILYKICGIILIVTVVVTLFCMVMIIYKGVYPVM